MTHKFVHEHLGYWALLRPWMALTHETEVQGRRFVPSWLSPSSDGGERRATIICIYIYVHIRLFRVEIKFFTLVLRDNFQDFIRFISLGTFTLRPLYKENWFSYVYVCMCVYVLCMYVCMYVYVGVYVCPSRNSCPIIPTFLWLFEFAAFEWILCILGVFQYKDGDRENFWGVTNTVTVYRFPTLQLVNVKL
jgi:hypothetical protein